MSGNRQPCKKWRLPMKVENFVKMRAQWKANYATLFFKKANKEAELKLNMYFKHQESLDNLSYSNQNQR